MPDVHILGIETSCDETGAAVVRSGREILSNVVASQVELHRAAIERHFGQSPGVTTGARLPVGSGTAPAV